MAREIRFNCGEYLPGLEPINIGDISPPSPPIIIPQHAERPTKFPFPDKPDTPDEPDDPQIPDEPGIGRPRIPSSGGGTTGGGEPGGQPGQVDPRIPVTHPAQRYRCNPITFYCPDDMSLPQEQRRIMMVKRYCVVCDQILDPETGQYVYQNDCIYDSRQQCEVSCRDSSINSCISLEPQVVDQTISEEIELPNYQSGSAIDIGEYGQGSIATIDSSSLYNPNWNIFNHRPTDQIIIVPNSLYPNIFHTEVAKEVGILLNISNSNIPWDTRIIQNVTSYKVEISLNRDLLANIDRIKNPGGVLIGRTPFVESIRRHLLEGTLDEFDTNFIFTLAHNQITNPTVSYRRSRNRELTERAVLGLLSSYGQSVNTSALDSIHKRRMRRQRRLNSDIGARIPICQVNGEESFIFSDDAGLCLATVDYGGIPLVNAPGDGYYFFLDSNEDGCLPFAYQNNAERTFYPPQEVRQIALDLLGEDSAITLRATSTQTHEFTYNDIPAYSLTPLYFSIDLSSIETIPRSNSLIDRNSVNFNLITDQDEINAHLDSNGFAVTRANIDYRDPIFRYALETSSLTLEQSDITFRAFEENNSTVGLSTLARTIPFGILLTPVAGGLNNPFNGRSTLEGYANNEVTRSIRMVPALHIPEKTIKTSGISEVNLYNESGEYQIGEVEPKDIQNVTYRIDTESDQLKYRFRNFSEYTSSIDLPSSYGASYLIKDVIDFLIDSYNPSSVSWYDIMRRIPVSKLGQVLYDVTPQFLMDLMNGYREGLKIVNVLNRAVSFAPIDTDEKVILGA